MARYFDITTVNPQSCTAAERTDLSPEWRVLLACCSTDQVTCRGSFDSLLDSEDLRLRVNWQHLLTLADSHGVSSLLCRNLLHIANLAPSNLVPASVVESLRGRHESNVRRALLLARELMRVLDCADATGADLIAYKGTVLADLYYGDMALRQAGDIDLFVRRQHFRRMKNALRDLGYLAENLAPEDYEPQYLASGYECSFNGAAGNHLLELQWALQPRFYAVDFSMESLFARARQLSVAGREVTVPSPEDLLLVLSVHAAKHVWSKLIWICDLAQILRREELDWDSVRHRAEQLGILRILSISLRLSNRLLGTQIPIAIAAAVNGDSAASSLAAEVEQRMLAEVPCDTKKISYFRMMLRLRERQSDRLRFLWRLAVTPGPGEWQAVRLPRPLFPLYRVVRIARLAARFTRNP